MSADHEHKEMKRRITDVADDLLECKSEVGQELEKGNIRMNRLDGKIDDALQELSEMSLKISLLIEIFEAGHGALKVMGWIGKGVKWLMGIGIAVYAIKIFLTTGHWK